jgi:hypothetical protein
MKLVRFCSNGDTESAVVVSLLYGTNYESGLWMDTADPETRIHTITEFDLISFPFIGKPILLITS